ncbi:MULTISPECIES: GNAT family N-acetyltransferase [Bacillaceae]|uniref:GNAT family acetyltransferase n=2 Tax=Priestia TaxID=2800373 RepID=A0A0V8JKE3_9BACI|nr:MULTISPECIES: GNAT family N-acetyltransferase [Bacillaceae]USY53313.1 GNAT family N-acetyltransferase [Bacillus sp. 1780r2a1]KSU87538.1 GNAT family acetyltransferase [Priestia veravalensis]MDT2046676.1 GNAT family N-acetyltransferase [Priestia flexa]MEC0667280.1 GNAT family N-acetyltransferase [Priestia flexa]MED3825687.1 GNAT family N-acetyltransferase [Priestia flexa]
MKVRSLQDHDVKELIPLMEQLGYPTNFEDLQVRLSAIQASSDYHTLIAEIDGEVAGMAGLCKSYFYEYDGSYTRIVAFVVHEKFRRKAVGKMLIKEAERWAKSQGCMAIGLNSGNRDERLAAHLFYQKMGYQPKSTGFIKEIR